MILVYHANALPEAAKNRSPAGGNSTGQFGSVFVAAGRGCSSLRTCNVNPDYAKYVKSSDLAQPKHIQNESWHILGYEKNNLHEKLSLIHTKYVCQTRGV